MGSAQLQKGYFVSYSLFNVDINLSLLKGNNCVLLNSIRKFIEIKASDLFYVYVQLSHIKEYRYLKNLIYQIDENERLLLSACFRAKFELI